MRLLEVTGIGDAKFYINPERITAIGPEGKHTTWVSLGSDDDTFVVTVPCNEFLRMVNAQVSGAAK